ncbi:MAG: D-alanine--D-alanine ligase [Nocardioidaceae bacterium]|nr:D-alanine--D-alanine ligase [Nocardioidaceae bacterium]MDQ3165713.1 D-alanine--D-alanine ligase [Actinomycetota bacterium]
MISSQNGAERPRVAVVFGGRSSEHGVSCLTAGEVIAAIDHDRFDVVPIGITTEGRWVLESSRPGRFAITAGGLPVVDPDGAAVALASDSGRELVVSEPGAVPHPLGEVDVVLPLLHGPWGEDGTIQGLFELAGVRYVGAGVLASAVGMDKHFMKLVFAAAGLAQMPHILVRAQQWQVDRPAVRERVAALGYPVFVKPARAGSSFGISRVEDPEALDAAVEVAHQYDPKVLVEAAALGARELECGVLQGRDGAPPEASVVGEIELDNSSGHTFYDFVAKYVDGGGVARVPADVPGAVAQDVRRQAIVAFEALGCEGLARVDFFWMPGGQVLVNEINTMPGFTPTSMFPALWAASGLDYPALVDRLLCLALDRSTGLR